MLKPIVSIMIPSYNQAALLHEALTSVMIQYDPGIILEVWVVDDCSTADNPWEVVNSFPSKLVKYFQQPENVGQVRNLNKCIELAKGDLIHILHCDDRVLPGFYQSIINAYNENPDCGAFFTRNNYLNNEGSIVSSSQSLREGSGFISNWFEMICTSQQIQTPSIVVKKEVYEKLGGFTSELSWTEDWEMWVRLSKDYRVYYIDEILSEYRFADISNSSDSFVTGRFILDLEKAINFIFRYHKSSKIMNKSFRAYSPFIINTIVELKKKKRIGFYLMLKLILRYFQFKFFYLHPILGMKLITKALIRINFM